MCLSKILLKCHRVAKLRMKMFRKLPFVVVVYLVLSVAEGFVLKSCDEVASSPNPVLCSNELDYRKNEQPPKRPLRIEVHCGINDVTNIIETDSTITLNLNLQLTWTDLRINVSSSSNSEGNGLLRVDDEMQNSIWFPTVFFYNLRGMSLMPSVTQSRARSVWLIAPNKFQFTETVEVTFTCAFNYTAFPFDEQDCTFEFGDNDYGINNIVYDPATIYYKDLETTSDSSFLRMERSMKGFYIHVSALDSLTNKLSHSQEQFSYTGFHLKMKRKYGNHIASYYGPTFLFVVLSWLSFAIPVQQVPGRMGLLITTSLIMVNTYGNVDMASPPQRGFGLIDMWMCGTQLPVSLSMLQYGYILYKIKNGHSSDCNQNNKRVMCPNNSIVRMGSLKSLNSGAPNGPVCEMVLGSTPSCCENIRFSWIDKASLISAVVYFLTFNVLYWGVGVFFIK